MPGNVFANRESQSGRWYWWATSRFKVAHVPENTLVIHGEVDDTVPLLDVLRWAGETGVPVMVMPGVEHFFHGKLPQLKELVVRYYPS